MDSIRPIRRLITSRRPPSLGFLWRQPKARGLHARVLCNSFAEGKRDLALSRWLPDPPLADWLAGPRSQPTKQPLTQSWQVLSASELSPESPSVFAHRLDRAESDRIAGPTEQASGERSFSWPPPAHLNNSILRHSSCQNRAPLAHEALSFLQESCRLACSSLEGTAVLQGGGAEPFAGAELVIRASGRRRGPARNDERAE